MATDHFTKIACDLLDGVGCAGGVCSASDVADAIRDVVNDAVTAEREACATLVERNSEFGDCKGLGTMDPETGTRECGARECHCEPKIEHGEMLAAKIRARGNQ